MGVGFRWWNAQTQGFHTRTNASKENLFGPVWTPYMKPSVDNRLLYQHVRVGAHVCVGAHGCAPLPFRIFGPMRGVVAGYGFHSGFPRRRGGSAWRIR